MNDLNISTNRLSIRNLRETDEQNFYHYRSNPEVTKYQGFDPYTLDECKAFIDTQKDKKFGKAGEWVQYGIEEKITQQLIGDCAIQLEKSDIRIAQIGITIAHTAQKRGFAKEAVTGILNYLFSIDDFHRVYVIIDVENIASVRLFESIGFRQEGHFKQNIFFNGKWGSEYQYAMLRSEWDNI